MFDKLNVEAHSQPELFVLLTGRGGSAAAKPARPELAAILVTVVLLNDLLPIHHALLVRIQWLDVQPFELVQAVEVELLEVLLAQEFSVKHFRNVENALVRDLKCHAGWIRLTIILF